MVWNVIEIKATTSDFRFYSKETVSQKGLSFKWNHDVISLATINYTIHLYSEPGSSVSMESGYGLDDRATEVRSPTEAKGFFL
jgi:hypothetical protein